jgi:DNA-binding Lrp family transcriptional regulator
LKRKRNQTLIAKFPRETIELLQKLSDKAHTTTEILQMTSAKRCSQLRRLKRLEKAGVLVRKTVGQQHYWLVVKMPEELKRKPKEAPPKYHLEEITLPDGSTVLKKVYDIENGGEPVNE